MGVERVCTVCGRDVGKDPGGVMRVHPEEGGDRYEYFCAEHNPNPPTPEQVADMERQEFEAGMASLRAEVHLIRSLVDLDRPVTPADRANIATELLRMLDRFIGFENKFRAMEGKPPIPMRHDWEAETVREDTVAPR
jgi:hypothetical protein